MTETAFIITMKSNKASFFILSENPSDDTKVTRSMYLAY